MTAFLRSFLLLLLVIFQQIDSGYSSCTMPTAWLGSWYQHGMNSLLEITIDYMQTKGSCSDVLPIQQYYLFIDQSTRCTRCLRFIQRHVNLLQYRESECNDADDLLNITSCSNMIAPDAVLYTLHRNDSKPHPCPIQPPFLLTDLIKDQSVCSQSISSSYINECAHDYQMHLHLSPCLPSQRVLDLQLICVGTWKEDLHTYFVTRIHHPHNNQYACFRYMIERNSSSRISLHMARDDSCHDLYSRQMSTVMSLSSKVFNTSSHQFINQSCTFPLQFQSDQWYSINHTIRMMITGSNMELFGINKRFHCQQTMTSEISTYLYRIRTFTQCNVKDECLRLVQRTSNVLELYIISLSKDHHCSNYPSHFHQIFYLKSSSSLSHPCPNSLGHLIYQSNIDYHLKREFSHMSIGCDEKEKLIISEKDQALQQRTIIQIDTCVAFWQSDDHLTTSLIIQSQWSKTLYCLTFQMTNPIIIHNNSHGCSFDSSEEEQTIRIYSARLLHRCSHSCQLTFAFIEFFFINIIILSFQTVNFH